MLVAFTMFSPAVENLIPFLPDFNELIFHYLIYANDRMWFLPSHSGESPIIAKVAFIPVAAAGFCPYNRFGCTVSLSLDGLEQSKLGDLRQNVTIPSARSLFPRASHIGHEELCTLP